jgi:hypothetical protein
MDLGYLLESGGETGIRTLETREGLLVFKTSAFNRSAISPNNKHYSLYSKFRNTV